jgi:surfeit locus 1 family protein
LRSPFVVLAAAAAVVALCVSLGNWQLRRLDEKEAWQESVSRRMHEPAVPLLAALDAPEPAFQRVAVEGRWAAGETVLLDHRSRGLESGSQVITPLRIAGSERVLLVDRGFAPWNRSESFLTDAEPDDPIHLEGVLLPLPDADLPLGSGDWQPRRRWNRLHPRALERQLGATLEAWLLVLIDSEPGAVPIAEPPMAVSAVDHRYYAIQWYGFAAVAGLTGLAYVWNARRLARARL